MLHRLLRFAAWLPQVFIGLVFMVCLLGSNIRPDASIHANQMCLPVARMQPGFTCYFIYPDGMPVKKGFFSGLLFGGHAQTSKLIPVKDYKITADGIHAEVIAGRKSIISRFIPKSELADARMNKLIVKKTFWLGTDKFGRDFLSRLMAGSLVSFSVGFIAVGISLLIGISLGALAGYLGGRTDILISWFFNVIWAIPTLLLVMAITLLFGKGFWQVFVAVGCSMWVDVARMVRGQFISLREREYVMAARLMGFGHTRMIFRHMLPNAWGPVIVMAAGNFANAILLEAGLSFLGIGAQAPMASWGGIIKDHYGYITMDGAYLAIYPGICIMLLVLSFMMIGNRLRDYTDVRNASGMV
ncbi:MAG: ABC transporter permease [Bacteroidota bacterium]|jgi:ABC-type dipeptide/oligopeptide/nickel transport system permease subunit